MKRWHLSVFMFLAVATALLLAGGAAAETPCDAADKLFKLHLYDAAQTNYTALLNNNPNLTCAQNGSLEVQRAEARNHYELGRAYENANQVNDAKVEYAEALKIDPNFSNATEALARMNGGVLTLTYTLYTYLLPALEIIVAAAIGLIVSVLAILITIYKIYPSIKDFIEFKGFKGFKRPRLDIGDFDKGATGLDIDKGLAAIVQEKYITLGHEGSMRVNLVEGAPDKFQIPADVNVAPYFKFLSEIINWLFSPYVITLSGHLQKPGSLGSGITVALVDNRTKKILDSCTIWQNELDLEITPNTAEKSIDPTSYYNLAEPVAIWVHFQLGKLSKKDEFTMMGTNDWKSYAYFKSGVRWYLEGKSDKAHQLYVESLDSGMNNWGTLLNLGRMEMEEGQYQHAFERLKMAKEKTISDEADKLKKFKDFPRNRIWYLATYSLVLTYCYLNKRYKRNLTKLKEETEKLTIDKSHDAIQKKDEMVLECNLSMYKDKSKTLLESIQKAKDDLQIAEIISHLKAEKTKHYLDQIKKSVETIRESIKAIPKNEEKTDLSNEVKKIEKAINELLNNESAPFVSIMSKAEEEAKILVYAIKKAIGKPLEEQEAKKLADKIQEAIDTQQNNEDKYTSTLKDMADKLVDAIKKAIGARQKNDEKELKEFLELFYPMASIMHANTLLYVYEKKGVDDAGLIINDFESSGLTYRGRYNLACYYSVLGDNRDGDKQTNAYRDSLCHLEYALERGGGIVKWAIEDPDLEGVRDDQETKEDFDKLIRKYAPQGTPHSDDLPLAGIAIIKEAYARQLKEQGITSYCDLTMKAATLEARTELSKKLGISAQLLHRWALMADLMRIVKDTKCVNLLEAADYGSIEALNNVSDPCDLVNLLNQINKAMSLVPQTPSNETVQQWVKEAKDTEPKVPLKWGKLDRY